MITLLTLNIEGSKHLERVIPFLKEQQAEVVCLQEIFEADMPQLKEATGCEGAFFPMMTTKQHTADNKDDKRGNALFTSLEHSAIEGKFYVGSGTAPQQGEPNKEDRVFVFTTVKKDNEEFTVGTTHFTWSSDGEANAQQREDLPKLLANIPKEVVFCGDFNAPRGKEIFSVLAERFTDNLPAEVTNTLDPAYHRKEGVCLAVDSIFSTPEYKVSDVQVIDGLSDHKALVAKISKKI